MRHEGLPILCKAASAPFINAIGNSTADNNDSKEKFGDELQLIHDKVSKIIGSNTASHRPNEGGHKIQKGIAFDGHTTCANDKRAQNAKATSSIVSPLSNLEPIRLFTC